jgi:hypothetical protein
MTMTSPDPIEANVTVERNSQDEMTRYGITRVPVDHYHYKQYRYTHLHDAIAQAERELASPLANGTAESGRR